jgi:hypothetical protein
VSSVTQGSARPPTGNEAPPPLERQERIELLLAQTGRKIVPIRRAFVQQGRDSKTRPGPLAQFLKAHDDRGLEAYLLVHAMASAHPWNCRLPSEAWVGALGLAGNAAIDSAKTAVSKTMRRLEDRKLITRDRSKRLSDITLLKEDGSGEPYERPEPTRAEDRWLQLPYTYWLEGHYTSLCLPAKVMLLIALSLPDGFHLAYGRAPAWYGVSVDSAEQGLRELRRAGLLSVQRTWFKTPRSATGWTEQLLYTLQGSFSQDERKKASRFRGKAITDPADWLMSADDPFKEQV